MDLNTIHSIYAVVDFDILGPNPIFFSFNVNLWDFYLSYVCISVLSLVVLDVRVSSCRHMSELELKLEF